jgi:hypothetical protein
VSVVRLSVCVSVRRIGLWELGCGIWFDLVCVGLGWVGFGLVWFPSRVLCCCLLCLVACFVFLLCGCSAWVHWVFALTQPDCGWLVMAIIVSLHLILISWLSFCGCRRSCCCM